MPELRIYLPNNADMEPNTGMLRIKGAKFLPFLLAKENPYQFVKDFGETGTLCERFMSNAKRTHALTPVLSGNFENYMLN